MANSRAIRAGRAFLELSVTDQLFKRGLAGSQRQMRAFGATVKQVGGQLARIGTFGGAGGGLGGFAGLRNLFVGSVAAAALTWPIKMAANIEVAAAQLSVFVGSADKARTMLLDLQAFSAISMVPFEDLARGVALLIRYGVAAETAAESTKALAVLAAGDAEEFQKLSLAFAQVASAGKLQGEEMRQLKNTAFNPIREIAERTGETMDEVRLRMEAGKVSFKEVAAALQATIGPGGRFHGLLQAISGTLLGQMRKAMAAFKQAVLPLGEELLSPIARFFRAINGAMPAIAQLIKNNSALFKIIVSVSIAVAAAAIAFTTLGLGFAVLSIAASGVAAAFGVLAAIFGAIVSLPGVLIIGLIALAVWFIRTSTTAKQMARSIAATFRQMRDTVNTMLGGIADALAAGEIQLAADVLWAGLKLAWLQGTASLRKAWNDFKDVFMRTTIDIVFGVQKHFSQMVSAVKRTWAKWVTESKTVGEKIGHYLSRSDDPELQAEQDAAHEVALEVIRREGGAEQVRIASEMAQAQADLDAAHRIAIQAQDATSQANRDKARKELKDAEARLAALRKKAKDALENQPKPDPGAAGNFDFGGGLGGLGNTLRSTFNARLAPQIFGGAAENLPRKQLIELRKIHRELTKIERKKAFALRTTGK